MWMHALSRSICGVAGLLLSAFCLMLLERLLQDRSRRAAKSSADASSPPRLPFVEHLAAEFRRMLHDVVGRSSVSTTFAARPAACLLVGGSLIAFAAVPFGPGWIGAKWASPPPQHESVRDGAMETSRREAVIVPGLAYGLPWTIAFWGLTGVAAMAVCATSSELDRATTRAAAFIVLPVSLLGIVVSSGSLTIDGVVLAQVRADMWNIVGHSLGLAALLLCVLRLRKDGLPRSAVREEERGTPTSPPDELEVAFPGAARIAAALQSLLAAYLIAHLFLGGWHAWGMTSDPEEMSAWLPWLGGVFVLHAKVFVVWWACASFLERGFRRLPVLDDAWKIALFLTVLDLGIALIPFESLLDDDSWMARGAIGWSILAGMIAWGTQRAARPTSIR